MKLFSDAAQKDNRLNFIDFFSFLPLVALDSINMKKAEMNRISSCLFIDQKQKGMTMTAINNDSLRAPFDVVEPHGAVVCSLLILIVMTLLRCRM